MSADRACSSFTPRIDRDAATCGSCGAPAQVIDRAPPGEVGDVLECSVRCDLSARERRRMLRDEQAEQRRVLRLREGR